MSDVFKVEIVNPEKFFLLFKSILKNLNFENFFNIFNLSYLIF